MPDTTAIANSLSPDAALASSDQWSIHVDRWDALIRAGVLPNHIQRAGQAIAIARFGQIYGKDPMWSIHNIHVVEGRCELSAAAMMGMILEHAREVGDTVTPKETTRTRAAIEVQRKGLDPEPVTVEFTIEDAKPLIPGKNGPKVNWSKFPADMLWARCVSRVGRRLYPDVIQGAYVHGEVMDSSGPTVEDRPRFSMQQLDDPPPETPPQQNDDIEPPDTWEPGDGPDKESPNGHTDMDT